MTFPKYVWATKCYASRLLSFVAHIISLWYIVTKFQQLYPCFRLFEVQLFNGVVNDVTRSRIIPEIHMVAAQTGSNTI